MRLFVAIAPPEETARRLREEVNDLPDLPPHRLTPIEQVHMTVQFIGEVSPRELPAVEEAVERSVAGLGRFTLRPVRIASLPEGGRAPARLVAAMTDAPPELLEIHRRLAVRLAHPRRGRADVETERFLPHLTLCRFEGAGVRGLTIDRPVVMPVFVVEAVRLMRSQLRPGGATHHEARRVPLIG